MIVRIQKNVVDFRPDGLVVYTQRYLPIVMTKAAGMAGKTNYRISIILSSEFFAIRWKDRRPC